MLNNNVWKLCSSYKDCVLIFVFTRMRICPIVAQAAVLCLRGASVSAYMGVYCAEKVALCDFL